MSSSGKEMALGLKKAMHEEQGSRMDTVRPVLQQLVREMGIPFLIAIAWTIYSLWAAPDKRNAVDAVAVFGGSFFLASWAFAQWFRVKKQQSVESGLGGIVKKQEGLLETLADAAQRLEGHASGGDSFGWLMLVNPQNGTIRNITAHVEGAYPLLEAKANVVDYAKAGLGLEDVQRTGNIQDFFKHHVRFDCGTLHPGLATLQGQTLSCDTTQPSIRFRVEWTARNGRWNQFVELKRNGDRYDFYTAVQRGHDWVFENPKRDSIPKRPDGQPDVFWHAVAQATAEGTP
jgi:hypothetical protein